jgi:hypothetical protein
MKDPIKIIHKFKNNYKRIQYKVYIFLGSIIPENILTILDIIKNKDFFTSLIKITLKQYNILKDYYGIFWYEKFFISYHLKNQIKIINTSLVKKKEIENKYGKDWYYEHIKKEKIQRIAYSFENTYYDNLLDIKKITLITKHEQDFTTYANLKAPYVSNRLEGGADDNYNINEEDIVIDDAIRKTDDENVEEIIEEDIDEIIEEDLNLDELTNLYLNESYENSENVKETSKLISDAINDNKWSKNIEDIALIYDTSFDNITYDEKLTNIFTKYYIFEEYIFKNDSIKVIRQKITVSIPLSPIFNKLSKILPESQFFWSEYYNQNGKDEVMLGQKWLRKNELLKIDIKPNENITVYEKLRNNLSYLKDSFGYKIKREDDETNILSSYDDFMTNNEIFMLDVFNDLGMEYNPDPISLKNLFDVYINIYFPQISYEKLENIIELFNSTPKMDKIIEYTLNVYISIKNDTKIENQVYTIVENSKLEVINFESNFNENYIIQSNIHVNLNNPKNITGTVSDSKYNLYRIFDNFDANFEYPFIQYQTLDSQIWYKFNSNTEYLDNNEVILKWFENSPYGISFKILIENNKYVAITLYESGRIEYKITWKEENKATILDIIKTYDYIRNLLKKINSENKKIKFMMPEDNKFKYAFINTIQKFTIPEKFKINHNDLSEFSRLFFPYVSLVIEPKKRVSKKFEVIEKTSKYGTYLRYKRIAKYDNRTKLHLRILYFLRNFEINDLELIDEISKQFNITTEFTVKEIDFVREKYGNVIKKSSKILKKLKALPKAKPPGIGIDIQGRDRDKYKIRITGARNKEQLDDIVIFMKTLIFLYCETYLYNKSKYQKLKEILKTLTNIASRRNKVIEIVDYEPNQNTVKSITSIDKKRLGFKPEKGQNQWTRSCQNSGNDKKRRPNIINADNVENLIKSGYKKNEKTGYYEKTVEVDIKKKKKNVIIRAIKLQSDETAYNFYTCDPQNNQEHFHIGFLSRGNNPSDLCMPCCFKKDQLNADNDDKRNYYLKCIGEKSVEQKDNSLEIILGDKIYILQETNKVQDGRFIYLPKYLDIFFNQVWNHDHRIKNHYLYESKSGYYFKYTIKNDNYNFLASIASIFEKSVLQIIDILVNFLQKDNDDIYFTYLNNGDIKEAFKTKENFIEYIKTSTYLDFEIIGELISIAGVLNDKGIYFFILEKNNLIVKKALEKDIIVERYYLKCLNFENNYMMNENRDFIILIKDGKYYHPIYNVQKDEKKDKKIKLYKKYENNKQIEELKIYSNKSCDKNFLNKIIGNYMLFCKNIIINLKNKIKIKKQYIDNRNKIKYLLLENNLFLPVFPSGISYDYKYDNVSNMKKFLTYTDTIKELEIINKILNMDYIPKIIFYDKIDKDKIRIISIFLENELIIPVKNELLNESDIKKLGILVRFQSLEETIDSAIELYNENPVKTFDQRYLRIRQHSYKNEAYNMYRLELSLYLVSYPNIKTNIIDIVRNSKKNINDRKNELRKILFNMIDNKLAKKLSTTIKSEPTIAHLENNLPNLENYNINNLRDYCKINKSKNTCNNKLHCNWKDDSCKLMLTETLAIDFVNKILEEMLQNSIQFKELIEENNYYVSDIVDYTQHTYRPNQKIIKTSNFNLNKIMSELFGKDNIPTIGRKLISKKMEDEIIEDFPELVELGKQLLQPIISNKDSIIRAFVNCYYWINNSLYDIESRNLGYYSEMQTLLTNHFKANITDYIQNSKNENNDKYNQYLKKYFDDKKNFFNSSLNKFRKYIYNTNCKLELLVLSLLTDYRIVVYNNYYTVIYLFLQGEIEVNEENIKHFSKDEFKSKTIFIKLEFDGNNTIPKNFSSIYYH